MIRSILIASIFAASCTVMAETATFKIKGMHCSDCVAAVKSKVCGTMTDLTSCKPSLVSSKYQIGKLVLTGKKIDIAKVKSLVSDAGYKVVKTQTK